MNMTKRPMRSVRNRVRTAAKCAAAKCQIARAFESVIA
jgi:hypothetical protein